MPCGASARCRLTLQDLRSNSRHEPEQLRPSVALSATNATDASGASVPQKVRTGQFERSAGALRALAVHEWQAPQHVAHRKRFPRQVFGDRQTDNIASLIGIPQEPHSLVRQHAPPRDVRKSARR